jgi:hypothetical protein
MEGVNKANLVERVDIEAVEGNAALTDTNSDSQKPHETSNGVSGVTKDIAEA